MSRSIALRCPYSTVTSGSHWRYQSRMLAAMSRRWGGYMLTPMCIYPGSRTRAHALMHTLMHTYARMHAYALMRACTSMHTYARMRTYAHVCERMHACTHACAHARMITDPHHRRAECRWLPLDRHWSQEMDHRYRYGKMWVGTDGERIEMCRAAARLLRGVMPVCKCSCATLEV
jgi:hypothetical protein